MLHLLQDEGGCGEIELEGQQARYLIRQSRIWECEYCGEVETEEVRDEPTRSYHCTDDEALVEFLGFDRELL